MHIEYEIWRELFIVSTFSAAHTCQQGFSGLSGLGGGLNPSIMGSNYLWCSISLSTYRRNNIHEKFWGHGCEPNKSELWHLPVHWHSQSGLLLVNLSWNGCTILQGNCIFWLRLGLRLFIRSEKHWILFERQWKLKQWSISWQTLYSLCTLQWDSSCKIWFPHYFKELTLIEYILNYICLKI